jgi:ABC-type phosphate transport system substrate-binding protein
MTRSKTALGLGAGLVAALTLCAGTAHADLAPTQNDIVGVGSDTVQNIANFLADGDTAGTPGYNSAGNLNRVVSFDATPDANDRAGYLNLSTNASLKPLTPTVVLRAGTSPVQRPNGSGAGIAALLADKASSEVINFVRASRLPSDAEQTTAVSNGWGGLHVVRISTDDLKIAAATTTNAPAALTPANLVAIYQCTATTWTAVGGTSSATIIPLVPQNGSGTRSTFLADLKAANGGTAVTLGSCVQTVEENDPTSITGATSPADAIAPFSSGRLALYTSGYFKDPTKVFGVTPTPVAPGISLLSGTGTYDNSRGLYIVFRNSDGASTKAFQPGGTKNWVQTLFSNAGGTTPFVNTTAGKADIASGGATPNYVDCGAGVGTTC